MQEYTISIPSTAIPAANSDFLFISAGSTRPFIVVEWDLIGALASSAYASMSWVRNTGTAASGGTAITPTAPNQPNLTGTTPALAFSGTVGLVPTSASAASAAIRKLDCNANGQRPFWRAPNGTYRGCIHVQAAGQLLIRSVTPNSVSISGTITIVEF